MGAVAILASLAFIGWIIWRAARRQPIKAHVVSYILTCVSGVLTLTFFLSMDLPEIVKILVSIIVGGVLIFIAAWFQRRANPDEQ
jgi:undecaprenyl pyrophosphate phosphatase UppP